LLQLSRRQSRILMVGHLLHYHPAIVELRKLVRDGELGRIEYISSSRLNLGKLRTEEDILWSFAPHDISAIVHLLEENPCSVAAHGGSYLNHPISDVTLTFLNFASGAKAHIFVSWLHPFKEQKLVVVGDRKMAVFDDTRADGKLVLYPHKIDWINRVPVARKMEGEVVSLSQEEPLKSECKHFLDCIAERRPPNTDGENGLRVLKILHAASESIREHGKLTFLQQAPVKKHFADPTAVVDDPCEIGEGTKIWHFSHVMSNTAIGKNCNFGQNVLIASGVRIGNNVKIQNNVSVYTGVELEDDVFCGPSMVFTNVDTPRSHVNRKAEYSKTLVRRGATLGANSTIVCGTTIGRYAFVGAGAVVTKDVPDYALVVGVPARRVGWACECGVRLSLRSEEWFCKRCDAVYAASETGLQKKPAVPVKTDAPRVLAAASGQD
jgi:UDP-2-acetamido-3-amino-2,3-dideoxy-glucuronate N-acetyltransferase